MSERQAGWYWVKSGRGWECARWTLGEWSITESDHHYGDGDFVEFGPRIPEPDEPWQAVPVELIDWIRGAQELMREMPGIGWQGAANQADRLLAAAPKP